MNNGCKGQRGRNLEVYVNDMLIKFRGLDEHLVNLKKNFIVIKNNKVWINLTKCVFGVTTKKFLGFILIERRIEGNLTKIKAILEMRSPTIVKKVQRLND